VWEFTRLCYERDEDDDSTYRSWTLESPFFINLSLGTMCHTEWLRLAQHHTLLYDSTILRYCRHIYHSIHMRNRYAMWNLAGMCCHLQWPNQTHLEMKICFTCICDLVTHVHISDQVTGGVGTVRWKQDQKEEDSSVLIMIYYCICATTNYDIYKRQLLVHVPKQMKLIHTPTPFFFNMRLNIVLPFTPTS